MKTVTKQEFLKLNDLTFYRVGKEDCIRQKGGSSIFEYDYSEKSMIFYRDCDDSNEYKYSVVKNNDYDENTVFTIYEREDDSYLAKELFNFYKRD